MKRRFLALLLCLSLLGSMTVYAEDTDPTEPPSPTEPVTEPVELITEPTEPVTEPTAPVTEPTEPVTEPTEPVTEPTQPVTEPTAPVTEPTQPATEPVTEPAEPVPTQPPIDEALLEKALTFIGLVENLPEEEVLSDFARALTDFSQIHALAEKDMPLPKWEVRAYEASFTALGSSLGINTDPVYPDSVITPTLQGMAQHALALEKDLETLELPELAAARSRLARLVEIYPALLESPTATLESEDISPISSAKENIQMHLFNYGPKINTPLSGYGFLPFIHSEGVYGWAVDSNTNRPSGSSGSWPVLQKVLQKHLYVLEDKNSVIKAGSLSYLFDPTFSGSGRVSKSAYLSNISTNDSSAYNPYQYGSVYLPVKNSDGSGTGLFRKEGRYYVYDSGKNAAWYNPSRGKFQLYPYVLRPAYTPFSTSATNGNFLPFNLGHTQGREDYQQQTYSKEYTYTDDAGKTVTATATVAKPDTVTAKPSGVRTAYRLYGNTRQSEVDLWFGMDLSFDFYQPAGGLVEGQPMEFEFLGDDDVFVFIDDVLILDIGGTHGAQAGRIDFATGKVTNPASYGQLPASSTLYALMEGHIDDAQFTDSDGDGKLDTFRDLSKHTLKFYYLERGGNVSYCRLKFNMDPLPVGSMSVEKAVTGIAGNIPEEEAYTFTLSAQPFNDTDTIESVPYTRYSITDPSRQETGEIPNGGSFSLKHRQKIVFRLDAGTTVTVTEEENAAVSRVQWTGSGGQAEGSALTYVITEEGSGEFLCTNTRRTGSLTLRKEVEGMNFAPEESFSFLLTFDGTPYTGPATLNGKAVTLRDGAVKLKDGESITLTGIPTGCGYAIREDAPQNGYCYHPPEIGGKTVAFGENFTAKFTQTRKITAINRHITADITLRKQAEGADQDFLFRLTGGTENTDLLLTLPAGGAVTVKDLPVGNVPYTAWELTDWSWRYTLQSVQCKEDPQAQTLDGGISFLLRPAGEEVTFANTRTQERWLAGDCLCENIWTEDGLVQRRERRA